MMTDWRRRRRTRGRRVGPQAQSVGPQGQSASPQAQGASPQVQGRGTPRLDRASRPAPLESVREQLRRQGAEARRRALVRRAAPLAALAAFVGGVAGARPLLREVVAVEPARFAVRHLAVVGAERVGPAELARAAAGADGSTPDGWTPEAVARRVAAHPWIASAHAVRVSADTVAVRVVERVPAAVWLRNGSTPMWVDASGTPFAPATGAEELPRLRMDADPVPASGRPDPRLAAGVALARSVEAAGFASPAIELDGSDPDAVPALRLPGVAPHIVLGAGDVTGKLARLSRLLAQVPESRGAGEIDLRFAGQVVLRPAPEPAPADAAPESGGDPPASTTGSRFGQAGRSTNGG